MAVCASGGVFFTFGQGQPMDTGAIALGLFLMAIRATNEFYGDIVVGVFGGDVGMAACARIGFVDRSREPGRIHE